MELKKIMNSSQGKIIISIILGLGLATMFKRVCKGRKCIVFEKASDEEIDNKIFKRLVSLNFLFLTLSRPGKETLQKVTK